MLAQPVVYGFDTNSMPEATLSVNGQRIIGSGTGSGPGLAKFSERKLPDDASFVLFPLKHFFDIRHACAADEDDLYPDRLSDF